MLEKIKNLFVTKKWSEQTIVELEELYKDESTVINWMFYFLIGTGASFLMLDLINLLPMTVMTWVLLILLLLMFVTHVISVAVLEIEIHFKKIEAKFQDYDAQKQKEKGC